MRRGRRVAAVFACVVFFAFFALALACGGPPRPPQQPNPTPTATPMSSEPNLAIADPAQIPLEAVSAMRDCIALEGGAELASRIKFGPDGSFDFGGEAGGPTPQQIEVVTLCGSRVAETLGISAEAMALAPGQHDGTAPGGLAVDADAFKKCVADSAGQQVADAIVVTDMGLTFQEGTDPSTLGDAGMTAVMKCAEVHAVTDFAPPTTGFPPSGAGFPPSGTGFPPAPGAQLPGTGLPQSDEAFRKCAVAALGPELGAAVGMVGGSLTFGQGVNPTSLSPEQMNAIFACAQSVAGVPAMPDPPPAGFQPPTGIQPPGAIATPAPSSQPPASASASVFQQCVASVAGPEIAAAVKMVDGNLTFGGDLNPASIDPQLMSVILFCAQQSGAVSAPPTQSQLPPAGQPPTGQAPPGQFPPGVAPTFPPGFFPTAPVTQAPESDPRQAEFQKCVAVVVGAQQASAIEIRNGQLTFGPGLNTTSLTPQNLDAIQACADKSGLLVLGSGPDAGQQDSPQIAASSPEEQQFWDCLKATHKEGSVPALRLTQGGLPDFSIAGVFPLSANDFQIVVDCVPGIGPGIRPYRLSAEVKEKVLDAAAGANKSVVVVETDTGAAGSGFFISKDGLIMTNNHVTAGSSSFTVWLYDGRKFTAKLVGSVPAPDFAVLKIDNPPADISPLPIGSTAGLKQGQTLFAIGHPGGYGNWMATAGRFIELDSVKFTAVKSLDPDQVEHEIINLVSVVPGAQGNSGGPLLDLDGRVVGVVYGGTQRQHIKSSGAPAVAPFKIREYSVVAQIAQAVPIEVALDLAAGFAGNEALRPAVKTAPSDFTPQFDATARGCVAGVIGQQYADIFKLTSGGLPDFSGFGSKSLSAAQFQSVVECVPGLMLIPSPEVAVVEDFPPAFPESVREQAKAAAEKVRAGVVFLDANREATATGFLISSDGLILTNNHNIEKSGGQGLVVWTIDGRQFPARLVATVKSPDVALLKIDAPADLQPVTIGTSTELKPDQPLIVVGNPGGLGNWVPTLGRFVKFYAASDAQGKPVSEFEATTPTHQGNSGSPVADLDGRVVGILWGGGDPDGSDRQPGERPVPATPGVLEYLKVDDHMKAAAIEEALKLVAAWTGRTFP